MIELYEGPEKSKTPNNPPQKKHYRKTLENG
jgi:hypothetical protein